MNDELVERLEEAIQKGMVNFSQNDYGSDWRCIYCGGKALSDRRIDIQHADDCEGEALLKELAELDRDIDRKADAETADYYEDMD